MAGHSEAFYDTEGLKVTSSGRWNDLDALMRHPSSGGIMFVGSQSAASNLATLQEHNITHVVNCTADMPLYHEGSGLIEYLRYNITGHYSAVHSPEEAVRFVQPLFEFVGGALAAGHNVLVHCLAGAHRAGTSGILCLMHFGGLEMVEAIRRAKAARCHADQAEAYCGRRPCINPIGGFPQLLKYYDKGRRG